MSNALYVGLSKQINLPKGGFLFIDDEVPNVPRSRVFDPLFNSFNPLKNINYRGAADFVSVIDALFERGNQTLTKDSGLDFIFDRLEMGPKTLETLIPVPDKKAPTGHVWAHSKIERILRSHVLRRSLCQPANFSFNPRSMIFARLNRREISDFDATTLALFLMAHYKGQIIVDAFYLRELHISLLRECRLIASCNTLSELPAKLHSSFLQGEVIPAGTTYEDAVTLAHYARLRPDPTREDNPYNAFIDRAMS